jgi:hypothetical protein
MDVESRCDEEVDAVKEAGCGKGDGFLDDQALRGRGHGRGWTEQQQQQQQHSTMTRPPSPNFLSLIPLLFVGNPISAATRPITTRSSFRGWCPVVGPPWLHHHHQQGASSPRSATSSTRRTILAPRLAPRRASRLAPRLVSRLPPATIPPRLPRFPLLRSYAKSDGNSRSAGQ